MKTLDPETSQQPGTLAALEKENDELRRRLDEAEETILAIRSGAVDALVVEESGGHRIYTLEGADRPYRLFVEEMQQGAATLHADGTIAWCNRQLGELLHVSQERLIGEFLHDYVTPESRAHFDLLLRQGQTRSGRGEAQLLRADGGRVPVFLTFNALPADCGAVTGALVTDVTTQRHHEQLKASHAALRVSEERVRKELAATTRLQEISSRLIQEGDLGQLYLEILDAAMGIMQSDMASIQVLDEGKGALRLLAWRGFDASFGETFPWVGRETQTSCSMAMRTGRRVVVTDVETCDFIVGTSALEDHRRTGIRAVQSTPLFSRGARMLGMISTHWRQPHQPAEEDLRLLDVLARQAADLTERKQAEENLRASEKSLREANAELSQRLAELQEATAEIDRSRRAALNLMEDAVHAREALRQSEERQRSLISVLTDVTWATDSVGAFVTPQPAWEAFTGQSWEQHRGFGWESALHPEDRERVRAIWQRACESRTLYESNGRVWHAPSGGYRCFVARATPLLNADGSVREWVGTCTDVHEAKQTAEARSRLAAIVESSEDAIISKDLSGVITSWNQGAEKLFGYTAQESISQPVTMLIPPDYLDEEPSILERIRQGKSMAHYETVRRRKDGSLLDISLTISPIRDSDGRIVGASKVARDITDRKKAARALEESARQVRELYDAAEAARISAEAAKLRAEAATRAKDDFLAALSHELRTPLNPALLLATALADDPALQPPMRADIEVIARSITLQVQLVDDLLDLTRITGGKLRLDLQPIDAHDALREALEMVSSEIRERRISITLDLSAPRHWIHADPVRMQQVFWNVLKNATKFTPAGGAITVRTLDSADAPDAWMVEVTDTGIGIDPDMLETIFESFAQEHHEGAHRFGGLGLGLAITRRLVELQHGRIRARSDGRGCGATFRIEMPTAAAPGSVAADLAALPVLATTRPAGRRILLVEDHEMTRLTLVRLLERRGHVVRAAGTAAAALELAAGTGFDLVISDLGLPDSDGHTFMARLRDDYRMPGIALSGYGGEDDLRRSRESGFFTHLTKPVNIRALEAAISAAPPAPTAR